MSNANEQELTGEFRSPGGFIFGVQGWTWGEQRPTSITFFLNGTVRVYDQHGRPIKGTVHDNKPCYFDRCSHLQVVNALALERIDWQTLVWAGWPQLPYDKLRDVKNLPPTPIEELRKIKDDDARRAAIKLRREIMAAEAKEMLQQIEE
jgi:hypothetical protein